MMTIMNQTEPMFVCTRENSKHPHPQQPCSGAFIECDAKRRPHLSMCFVVDLYDPTIGACLPKRLVVFCRKLSVALFKVLTFVFTVNVRGNITYGQPNAPADPGILNKYEWNTQQTLIFADRPRTLPAATIDPTFTCPSPNGVFNPPG